MYLENMSRVSLFHFQNSEITVNVEAYFEGESLVIDGYDIGKTVEECWGDSDYEYSTTVPVDEVKKLYPLFRVNDGDKLGLLEAIKNRFHDTHCFSDFSDFLMKNNIDANGFSWT